MEIIGKTIKKGMEFRNRLRRVDEPFALQQEKTLLQLLQKSQATAFGAYYGFRDILHALQPVKAFRCAVPFHDYDSMNQQWWRRTLERENNVTWKGKVKYFALSSGTSGAPSKHLPITEDLLKSNKKAGLRMFFTLTQYSLSPGIFSKGMMMLGGSTDLEDRGGYFIGDLSGINARNYPFWMRGVYKPGMKIAAIKNWDERIAEIVRQAPTWDIGFIMGIPAWNQLMLERIIEHYKVDSIHDIWPNLGVFVHGGVSFAPYRQGFDRLMGKPMIYMDTYLASEGFLAFQSRPDTQAMALIPNNGIFYEFIPFDDGHFDSDGQLIGQPRALGIQEVEMGKDYALVISTNAGAWRYLIGDTVRFTDLERAEIIITGRIKHFLSLCGEHLSVDNMQSGIMELEREFNLSVPEFTVAGVSAGKYFAHKWYLGCDMPVDNPERITQTLDQALKRVNDDYRTEREGGVLKDIQLEILPTRFFYEWFRKQGKLGGQSKFPRVMKTERFAEWEAFLSGCRG